MKIHGITVIKNEGDIIRYSLREASQWCDFIYVFDNGSDDNTWEIVNQLAREIPNVIPFKQSDIPFNDKLRGDVFRHYKSNASAEDWWCRLDGDEVYIDNPKDFLPRISKYNHVVWSLHYQYYLTNKDLLRFGENMDFSTIPEISETNRPTYYKVDASEPRFFRHRENLTWFPNDAWPKHIGIVYKERIRLKHLQYRSPQQIKFRIDTRMQAIAKGGQRFDHWNPETWQDKIVDENALHNEDTHGLSPDIDYTEVPKHLEPARKRLMKYLLYPFLYR